MDMRWEGRKKGGDQGGREGVRGRERKEEGQIRGDQGGKVREGQWGGRKDGRGREGNEREGVDRRDQEGRKERCEEREGAIYIRISTSHFTNRSWKDLVIGLVINVYTDTILLPCLKHPDVVRGDRETCNDYTLRTQ